jgi:hypothetical protein
MGPILNIKGKLLHVIKHEAKKYEEMEIHLYAILISVLVSFMHDCFTPGEGTPRYETGWVQEANGLKRTPYSCRKSNPDFNPVVRHCCTELFDVKQL